ncbi:MAG: hypothetical protein M3Z49_10090, partial [Bifidobacteriales bacterium]|nr:hypothetical protein [Bifidobacteriales bacterium]
MQELPFSSRHIGPRPEEAKAMLHKLGLGSLEELVEQAVPSAIRLHHPLQLPKAVSEGAALHELHAMMEQNRLHKSFIGQGYYGTFVPSVILRNLFENPAWYTAYTPYQAEISQGRLEMLFNFQTLVCELTGLPIAAASLLDEATSLAEANAVAVRFSRNKKTAISVFGELHPQTLAVAQTRAETQGYEIGLESEITDKTAAIVLPWPDTKGRFIDHSDIIKKAKAKGALVIVVADPLALTIME